MSPAPQTLPLQAHGLRYRYRQHRVLEQINLDLQGGELLAILGANGAGKSTLLRLLLGLIRPDAGQVLLGGQALARHDRRALAGLMAYVPQAHVAPFPYTVADVVLMGRLARKGWLHAATRADQQACNAVLERLQIAHLHQRRYTEISGGERQLALLARALLQGARILIMDEPMNGLDYGRQLQLLQYLRALANEGYAILMTTHHPEHALMAATRAALLQDGRIQEDGPPAQVITPASLHRLYGVEVTAFHSAQGHRAFHLSEQA